MNGRKEVVKKEICMRKRRAVGGSRRAGSMGRVGRQAVKIQRPLLVDRVRRLLFCLK